MRMVKKNYVLNVNQIKSNYMGTQKKASRDIVVKCGKTYIWKLTKNIQARRFDWFKLWLIEGFTVKHISKIKKVSQSTVKRVINYWLRKEPQKQEFEGKRNLEQIKYVIFDGTYLNHKDGIYAVMNALNHKVIYGDYGIKEVGKDLKAVYNRLKQNGLNPKFAINRRLIATV